MPVKVVGSDVEYDGGFRSKSLNGLQLEARDLQHCDGLRSGLIDQRYGRSADVAADDRCESAGCNNFPRQRGGRGFAIRAGDGDYASRDELRRQFDLANDGFAQGAGMLQEGRIHRHPRADHDQVLPLKGALAVPSGFDRYSVVEENWYLIRQLILRLGVGDGHPRSPRLEKQRRGDAGFPQADYQHAFVVEVHDFFLPRRHRATEKT